MSWEEIYKRQRKIECIYILPMILCLIVAIIGEVRVANETYRLSVLNYDDVSLVIIQIQATVQTLSIALLALASSQMNEVYMGLNYNDFQFNIKPTIFTQKRIILLMILLLVINVFLHMAEFYNIVTAVFIIVCLLIAVSVKEIYAVFSGNVAAESEIKAYMLYGARNESSIEVKRKVFNSFCNGWRNKIETQSLNEYDEYFQVFNAFCKVLILKEEKEAREMIQQEAASIISAFNRITNKAVKERALMFLFSCYKEIWAVILSEQEKIKNLNGGVYILHEAYYDISQLVSSCTLNAIEKKLQWNNFIEFVILSDFWLGYEKEKCYELNDLSDFVTLMARQLSDNRSEEYDERIWGELLTHIDCYINVPEDRKECTDSLIADLKFRYAQTLIRCNMLELLKENFYKRAMRKAYCIISRNQAILLLKVHCYLYYLSEYESLECVTAELKDACRAFLEDDEIKRLFAYALQQIAELDDRYVRQKNLSGGYIFTTELVDTLYQDLRCCELFPRYENAKTMIMDSVVMDFIAFLSICASERLYRSSILQRIISNSKVITFHQRFVEKQTSARQKLERFLFLIGEADTEKKAERLLFAFQRIIRNRIKVTQMEQAEQFQQQYDLHIDENVVKSQLTASVKVHLNEVFKEIISDDVKNAASIRIRALRIDGLTDVPFNQMLNGNYDVLAQQIVNGLCVSLKQLGSVKVVNRNSFEDDSSFLEYLKSEDFGEVIGSDFAFKTKEYENRNKVDDIFSQKKCVLTGFTKQGLLLKKDSLRIYIQDVKIGIHSGELSEFDIEFDMKNNMYRYEVMAGMPVEFTEEELKKFLHDRRKLMDIVLVVSFKRDAGIIGDLLQLE